MSGFNASAAGATANALYAAMVDVPNIPNEFFQANVWRSPRHEAQESTSQLLFEKDFDEGSLTVSANVKKKYFIEILLHFLMRLLLLDGLMHFREFCPISCCRRNTGGGMEIQLKENS